MKELRLNTAKTIILKIGGSVITDKTEEMKARTGVIDRLASEIKRANVTSLVLVHGGGSFGHPLAERYKIKEGFRDVSQKMGFCLTHHSMTILNGLLMDALMMHEVPAVSITSSSVILTENGRIIKFEDTELHRALEAGYTPVLYGDTVFDRKLGFTILSGDQIIAVLASKLDTERVIIGVDVDGLYDTDPKHDRSAKLFEHLNLTQLRNVRNKLDASKAKDVTGGMAGKIAEIIPVIEKGIPLMMINTMESDSLFLALKGEDVKGTKIEKE